VSVASKWIIGPSNGSWMLNTFTVRWGWDYPEVPFLMHAPVCGNVMT
jgi:hypothetical protein